MTSSVSLCLNLSESLWMCVILSLSSFPLPGIICSSTSSISELKLNQCCSSRAYNCCSVTLQHRGQLLSLPSVHTYLVDFLECQNGIKFEKHLVHRCLLLMPREKIPVSKYFRIINSLSVGDTKGLEASLYSSISYTYMSPMPKKNLSVQVSKLKQIKFFPLWKEIWPKHRNTLGRGIKGLQFEWKNNSS